MKDDRRLLAAEKRLQRLTETHVDTVEAFDFTVYRDDPVGFARDVLGLESATKLSTGEEYQFQWVTAINSKKRVVIVSCRRAGKTTTIGVAAIHFILTRPMSRVLLVAPTAARHLNTVLISEISTLVRNAKVPLPLEVLTDRVYVRGHGVSWAIVGVSSVDPDLAHGYHNRNGMLICADEVRSLPESLIDALQPSLSGPDAHLLLASTPGAQNGPLWKAWNDDTGFWEKFHVDGEDSSNVDKEYIEDRKRAWGATNPLYISQVKGQFCGEGNGALFPMSIIERAIACDLPDDPRAQLRLGVDVARSVSGDANVVCVTRGGKVERFALWRSPDTMVTVNRVIAEATSASPKQIYVDVGGVGGGVCDRLKQLRFPVTGVNFGGGANDSERFRNRRAEMFWTLREEMEAGRCSIPNDDELIADLCSIRYDFDNAGRIILESKDTARKLLGRSPDRGDALALAIGAGETDAIVVVPPFTVPHTSFYAALTGDY